MSQTVIWCDIVRDSDLRGDGRGFDFRPAECCPETAANVHEPGEAQLAAWRDRPMTARHSTILATFLFGAALVAFAVAMFASYAHQRHVEAPAPATTAPTVADLAADALARRAFEAEVDA